MQARGQLSEADVIARLGIALFTAGLREVLPNPKY